MSEVATAKTQTQSPPVQPSEVKVTADTKTAIAYTPSIVVRAAGLYMQQRYQEQIAKRR